MSLSDIIAVSGMSGLYKTVAQSKNSVIVESLGDKKRMPIYATQKVHTLEAISVFTNDKDIPLADVFKKISEKENKGPAIDHKVDDAELSKYFGSVLPDYDKERVHISDIRKMILWYNTLQKAGITNFEEPKTEDGEKVALPGETPGAPKQQHQKQKVAPKKPGGGTKGVAVQKQTVRKTGAA
jgi:hypothetical protein